MLDVIDFILLLVSTSFVTLSVLLHGSEKQVVHPWLSRLTMVELVFMYCAIEQRFSAWVEDKMVKTRSELKSSDILIPMGREGCQKYLILLTIVIVSRNEVRALLSTTKSQAEHRIAP